MSDQELEQKQRTPGGDPDGEIEDEGLVQRIKTPDLKEIISELEAAAANASKYAQYYDTVVWICDQGPSKCYCVKTVGDHQGETYTSNPYSLGGLLEELEETGRVTGMGEKDLYDLSWIKERVDNGEEAAWIARCVTIDADGKAEDSRGFLGRKTVKKRKT